ncbi:hypothetical protein D1BOALGB6SA_10351 [Olavius sp. associated proteobacterium Delta 1]|nr:hypothetical protein D1BOALGB6SA_10351 [Olavius sp. associated proteobacterium Delta 1]
MYWDIRYESGTEQNVSTIPSSSTTHSDNWVLSCSANDGSTNSTWTNSTTTTILLNHEPTYSGNINISPVSPSIHQDLTCYNETNGSDADNHTLSFHFKWYSDGAFSGIRNQVLSSGNTSENESWKCGATITDGIVNGTEIFSQSEIVNSNYSSPIVSSVNSSTQQTGEQSTEVFPTNRNETLNLSIEFTDVDPDNSWTIYFCNSTSVTESGCTDRTWCNSSANQSFRNVSCLVANLTGETIDQTYTYYAYVVDNTSLISGTATGTFHIGDDMVPIMGNHSVDATSETNGDIGRFYVDCSDEQYGSGIGSAYVWVYSWFDNGATFSENVSASLFSGNTYRALKAYNAVGIWGYRGAYCVDASGNTVSNQSVNINVSVSAAENPSGGGGGGGSDIDVDGVIDERLRGHVVFRYPGDTIKVRWFPITDIYQKEVVFTAKDGPVSATTRFSENLKPYMTVEICDLYTGECSSKAIMEEGEQMYVRISGNFSSQDFKEYFFQEKGNIQGHLQVLSGYDPGPYQYNFSIQKHWLFDDSQEYQHKFNSSVMELSSQYPIIGAMAGDLALTQKQTYYFIHAILFICIGGLVLLVLTVLPMG